MEVFCTNLHYDYLCHTKVVYRKKEWLERRMYGVQSILITVREMLKFHFWSDATFCVHSQKLVETNCEICKAQQTNHIHESRVLDVWLNRKKSNSFADHFERTKRTRIFTFIFTFRVHHLMRSS